jgi:hypothetical protein
MDSTTFDAMVRRLGSGLSRRQALRGLVAGGAAAAAGAIGLETGSAAKKKNRCKRAGAPCTKTKQCCPRETKRLCRVQRNAGNSDTTCCGGAGAKCGGKNSIGDDRRPFCCVGFECRGRTCRKA